MSPERRNLKWLPSLLAFIAMGLLIPFQYGEPYFWLTKIGLGLSLIHSILVLIARSRFPFWYNIIVLTVCPLVFDVGLGFILTPVLLVLLLARLAIDHRLEKRQGKTVEGRQTEI